MAQNGEWGFHLLSAILFVLTLWSLVHLNYSEPGIIHRGSLEQDPEAAYTAWMFRRAFQMPWCPHCSFHRPPRTFHCESCNICVEEFDHHSRWVNNCVGHRNIRLYLLLLLALCLYLGALLVTCVMFLVQTREMALNINTAMAFIVAVPATGALLLVILELVMKAVAVSTARRPYEGQGHFLQGENPFDQGCARNCYITMCAPLGPRYMSESVLLQREEGNEWEPMEALRSPKYYPAQHLTDLPGSTSQPMDINLHGQAHPGSGEPADI